MVATNEFGDVLCVHGHPVTDGACYDCGAINPEGPPILEHAEDTCTHDEGHCLHWYDGDECCRCGAPEMTNEERIAQGMPPKDG